MITYTWPASSYDIHSLKNIVCLIGYAKGQHLMTKPFSCTIFYQTFEYKYINARPIFYT